MPTKKHTLPKPGDRFGRLTVLETIDFRSPDGRLRHRCLCRCECGGTIEAMVENLYSGCTRSCGCVRVEDTTKRHVEGWRAAQKNNASGYKGVSYRKRGALRWVCDLVHLNKLHRSYHATPEEAADAYDELAIRLRGPNACINFPERHPSHPNRKPARKVG